MSMSIYIPYFYIIQHLNSGRYYAGVKYGVGSNPDNLLKPGGYQTSSDIIKQIILEEGLESFIIRKIKIFKTGEAALDYESRFLRRINASFSNSFLNRSNNSISTLNTDYEKRRLTCLNRYGYECSLQNEEVKEKTKQTMLEKYGVENAMLSEEIQEKYKQTNLERLGVEFPMQSEEIQEKYKQTCLEKYGVEYSSQSNEIKEKIKQSCLDILGVENPFQSEEVKEKSKQTNLDNRGVEFPSQSPEVREKIKKTLLEKYGVENPSQSSEIQEKKKQAYSTLKNRPIVLEIKKYRDWFKIKLTPSWVWKSQEALDIILAEIKMTYGKCC